MINAFIAISIASSFTFLITRHNKLGMSENNKEPFWTKTPFKLAIALVLYSIFNYNYDHLYLEWFLNLGLSWKTVSIYFLVGMMTVGLYILKRSSLEAQLFPGEYVPEIYKDNNSPYRMDMSYPLFFNALFYCWILFLPQLPFLEILFQGNK
jgi:hypothetical protein